MSPVSLLRYMPLAVPLLGEGGRNHCTRSQHCTIADGVGRKQFLVTYINAYLKNQYQFDCMLNLGFSHHFSLPPDSCLFQSGLATV